MMMSIKRRYVKTPQHHITLRTQSCGDDEYVEKTLGIRKSLETQLADSLRASLLLPRFQSCGLSVSFFFLLFLTFKIVPGCSVSCDQWSPPCLPPQTFEQSSNIRLIVGGFASKSQNLYFCILLLLQVFVPFLRFFTISIFLEPLFVLALHHFQSSDAPLCFLRHGSQHLTLSCQQQPRSQKPLLPPPSPLPSHYYFSHPTFGICGQITYFVNSQSH